MFGGRIGAALVDMPMDVAPGAEAGGGAASRFHLKGNSPVMRCVARGVCACICATGCARAHVCVCVRLCACWAGRAVRR